MNRIAFGLMALLLVVPVAAQTVTEQSRISAPLAFFDDADVTTPGMSSTTAARIAPRRPSVPSPMERAFDC